MEIIDRFGLLPDPLKRLFTITALKLTSQAVGITKVDIGAERGKFEFSNDTAVDPLQIVKLVQSEPNTYQLDGASTLRIRRALPDFSDRVEFAEGLLANLSNRSEAA